MLFVTVKFRKPKNPLKANSINEVISILDNLIQQSTEQDSQAGYFAALYKRMTIAVKKGIDNGQFENGSRMEQLDVIFANRYFEAFDKWKSKQQPTKSWQAAFNSSGSKNLIVMQHLILGINAHINLDLGLAAAQTAGPEIQALKNDFNKINEIISSLIDEVQNELGQICRPFKLLDRFANNSDEAVINFSIGIARKSAWNLAERASALNGDNLTAFINTVDNGIALISDRIIRPGFWISIPLKLIRFFEEKSVAQNSRYLNKY